MRIKILGSRGNIKPQAPRYAKHSGVLVDRRLLFDVGEKEFLKFKPKAIFVTHLHPDHAFFAGKYFSPGCQVYAPLRGRIKIPPYLITAVPTIHSIRVESAGYLIQKRKQKIFYSGDFVSIKASHCKLLNNLDLVITEASFMRKGGLVRKDKQGRRFGHTGIPDLFQFFKKRTARILFMHFGSWFYKDIPKAREQLLALGKTYNLPVEIGYDNYEMVT